MEADDPDGDDEHTAVEEEPGGWHGYLSYTLQGTAYGLGTGNWSPARFWRDGHGVNFTTVDHNAVPSERPCKKCKTAGRASGGFGNGRRPSP